MDLRALDIRPVAAAQAAEVATLVRASFLALAAADWEPDAQQLFLEGSSTESLAAKLQAAAYSAAAFVDGQMVGFLLMPTPALLGMLFVHPRWLRRGIGRALWERARACVEAEHPATQTVELNATPFAVAFYRAIGFVPISAEFRRGGCRATRMACWLPGRSLAASQTAESPTPGVGSPVGTPLPFPLVTRIGTPRLVLRPVHGADLSDLLEVNGDPEVTRFLPYETWRDLDDARAWLDRMDTLGTSGRGQQLVLETVDDARKVIGTLLLFNLEASSRRAELGYVLGRRYWGRGFMREALEALCSQAFGSLGLRRLEAEVNPDNHASGTLLRQLGFALEGRLRQRWMAKGVAYDTMLFGCLAADWSARERSPAA